MKARTLALVLFCLFLAPLPASAQQASTSGSTSAQDAQLASVAGQVLRADTGEPLRKARIILTFERDNSMPPYISITDPEGHFSINGIRPGRYQMEVQRDGFLRKSSAEDKSGNSESILSLAPGQKIADLLFRLQKACVISGRVFDEDGDPARSVQVLAESHSTHRGKVTTGGGGSGFTNDLGEYRIHDLYPGSYFVRALLGPEGGAVIGGVIVGDSILRSEGGYVPTYYPSSSNISRASKVDVQPGSEASGIDITLLRQRSFTVRGQVVNEAVDHPLSTAEISVYVGSSEPDSQDFGWDHWVYANPKTGEFEIAGVLAGSYRVIASLHDQQNEFNGSAPAEVVNSDLNGIRIVIGRGAEIHGRVIKEGNVAESSVVHLSLIPRDPETVGDVKGETNRDGSFSLVGVADGLYDVSAFSFDCNTCFIKSATAGAVDILETGVVVSSGLAPSVLQIVLSSKSATVEGTVRRDGLPVPGATVVLVSDHPRGRHQDYDQHVSTDRSGNFSIQPLEPGSYHAFAWRGVDEEDWEDPDFRQPFLPKAQAFSVSEDEKKTLQLTLLPSSADNQ